MTETITAAEYRALGKKPKGESESAATRRLFLFQISARKLPTPRAKGLPGGEVKFMGDEVIRRHTMARKLVRQDRAPGWSFDFAWERERIAVEVEGLVVFKGADGRMQTRGRHTTPEGFNEDCEKYAWAAVMGWTVVRFTPLQVKRGFAIDMLVRLFAARNGMLDAVVGQPVGVHPALDQVAKLLGLEARNSAGHTSLCAIYAGPAMRAPCNCGAPSDSDPF